MKKIIIPFLLCLIPLLIKAQDKPLPVAVSKLLPKDYKVLNSTSGDPNLDAYPDLIVVLNKANEKETSDVALHPEKRPLLIFIGGPGHTYSLVGRSDNVVYCVDCGGMMGDPFTGIRYLKQIGVFLHKPPACCPVQNIPDHLNWRL